MRVDGNRQKIDGLQASPDKATVSASDFARLKSGVTSAEVPRPELQLRVEALLRVLPVEPDVRTDRVREVATRLAEGGYVTQLAAYKTSAAILGTSQSTESFI